MISLWPSPLRYMRTRTRLRTPGLADTKSKREIRLNLGPLKSLQCFQLARAQHISPSEFHILYHLTGSLNDHCISQAEREGGNGID